MPMSALPSAAWKNHTVDAYIKSVPYTEIEVVPDEQAPNSQQYPPCLQKARSTTAVESPGD